MIFPAKFVIPSGVAVLISLVCLGAANSRAESALGLPEPLPSPTLESIDRPSESYPVGKPIPYRIRVRWPTSMEGVRMIPPDLSLDNLELAGVSQETESRSEENDSVIQILTFNFTAQAPGPAKIKRLSLKWILGNGAATSELVIPPIELRITHSQKRWYIVSLAAISTIGLGGLGFWFLKLKKKRVPQNELVQSTEDLILEQFLSTRKEWQVHRRHQEFLSQLTHLLKQYAAQKFDWNPSGDDYNALQKKAEQKWTKKEAGELMGLFHTLEYERFSGGQMEANQLEKIYQNLYTFIEQKKII